MQYRVDYIVDVPDADKLRIIRREMRKATYVAHHEYPQSENEWTLVFVYRR